MKGKLADVVRRRRPHLSLLHQVGSFMLLATLFAYGMGSFVGFAIVERTSLEQWTQQALINAQIAAATLRSTYTEISVETDANDQVVRIDAEQPIGDSASVLSTGFVPSDILALASAQTKRDIWLFQPMGDGFVSVASGLGNPMGDTLTYSNPAAMQPETVKHFYTGFARISGIEHFISAVPVINPSGELTGLLVASIGTAQSINTLRDGLIRQTLFVLLVVLAGTAAAVTLVMRRLFRPVPVLINALLRLAAGDIGTPPPYRDQSNDMGRLAQAIETLREAIVEREQLRASKEDAARQLEHMAMHDALTGLPNRAYLNKSLGDAIVTLGDGAQFALLIFDLDFFKAVNDTYGHAVGDALLIAVARRVLLLIGEQDLAVRLGGDEFAVIQRAAVDPDEEGGQLAQRIVEAMCTPFTINGIELKIGASVGVACAPRDGNDQHSLMTKADAALYAAKRAGRCVARSYAVGMRMERAGAASSK